MPFLTQKELTSHNDQPKLPGKPRINPLIKAKAPITSIAIVPKIASVDSEKSSPSKSPLKKAVGFSFDQELSNAENEAGTKVS